MSALIKNIFFVILIILAGSVMVYGQEIEDKQQ